MKKITELPGIEKIPRLKKLIRVMKLTSFLLLISVVSVMAGKTYSQTKLLNLDIKNATVKEILSKIEDQSEFYFMYSSKVIDVNREVSVDVKNQKIEEVLKSLFAGTDVDYTIKDRIIVLTTPEVISKEVLVSFQQKSVSGKVIDSQNQPLPGVTVLIKGTTQGVVTNNDGDYSIPNIPVDAVLVFSFVGMRSQEVVIGDQTRIDIAMEEDVIGIEEVVAVGYGTMRKGDLTGAVSTVSASEIERNPTINALEALQARSPGLQITSTSGVPGSDFNVQIRGVQSIRGTNAPIFVVDGVITDNINYISPDDIESFTVLKDASSTAIYGARAANGVILVTTKRGSVKTPEFTFHSYVGLQTEGNLKLDLLNADEFLEIYTEAHEMGGITPPWNDEILKYYEGVDTDWVDLMQRTGILQNYDFSVSGGSELSNYYISANYVNNKGMVLGTDYNKFSLRFNSDHKIGDWIEFGNSFNVWSSEKNGDENLDGDSYYRRAFIKVPLTRAYEDDGDYGKINNTALEHTHRSPIWEAYNLVNNIERKGLLGNLYLAFEPIEGLKFTARGNVEWNHVWNFDFVPGVPAHYQWEGGRNNSVEKESRKTLHWIGDFLLDYNKTFSEVHVIKALLGYSLEESSSEYLWGNRTNTPNNDIQYLNAGDPATQLNENGMSDWAYISTFGRLNYTYNNKYIFSSTVRRDGTSRLAEEKYGIFPSVAVAWRLSEETFLSGDFFDDLKLRASWGSVGNAQSISTYGTINSLTRRDYTLNQQQASGYTLSSAVNTDLKWESTVKKNFGVDAVLLNNKFNLTADLFIENTHDLLFLQPIPNSTGLTGSPYINAGEVKNSGYELELGYRTNVDEWSFNFNINISHVKNEVIDLAGRDLRTSGIVEGYPLRSFYGYKTNGLIRNNDDLNNFPHMSGKTIGDIWVLDVDGYDSDGNLTGEPDGNVNSADRTLIGKRYPDLISGANVTVGYKNFTLMMLMQGVHGVDMSILEEGRAAMHYFTMWAMNHDAVILDRYHPTKNPDGMWPKVSLADAGHNREFSDFWLDDASFLRVKNLNLNYNFNEKICSYLKMSRLGIYASVQNLYTFTSFHGTEVDTTTDPLVGVPQPRTWTFGLKATF